VPRPGPTSHTLAHEWINKLLQHRVADPRVLRLVQNWLRAGVSEEGQWSETLVGVPQGAVVSPFLGHVYLHDVFDLWVEAWRKKVAHGVVVVVCSADGPPVAAGTRGGESPWPPRVHAGVEEEVGGMA
jgi:hypothetical protein